VLTIASSLLSAVAFVTGNLAFASSKKKDDSSGGGGGSSKDKGGGSGGSSDNTGGGGGDNSNGGTSDTDNTTTPPPPTTEGTTPQPPAAATEQTCPDGSKPDPATGNCPPAATQQKLAPLQTLAPQQTCPDGSAPDANGNCPTTADQQNIVPPAGGGQTTAGPTVCPDGSMPDPVGNCPTPTNTPVQPQVKQVEVPANPDGSCPPGSFPVGSAGNAGQPGTGSSLCIKNVPVETPPATPPSNTPAAPKLLGNGVYELPNVPSINNPFAAPSCPSGYHLVRSDRCTADGVKCPSGTVQISEVTCGPQPKPTTTTTPAQPPTQIQVPANPDGSCPAGSFPVGSAGNAGQPGTGSSTCLSNTPPAGRPTDTPPATPTQQKLAPLQTLTPQQQTCKDGSTPNANGICQDGSTPQQKTCPGLQVLTDKGNCVTHGESDAIKNGTLVDIGNNQFQLGTRPPVPNTNLPNTNTISPICPSDTHLVGSKCVYNGASCPIGTVIGDDGLTCSTVKQVELRVNPDGTCPAGSFSVGSSGNAGQPGTGSTFCFKNVRVEAPCDQPDFIRWHGICYQGKETVPNLDGNCPPTTPILFEGRCLDKLPVLPGTSTGSGGGFIQMFPVKPDGSIGTSGPVVVYVPVNKDGTCPPGDEPASGGYCRHKIQSTPPAAPPTNTPPAQPQPPQQLAPSQPECVPGFHWDNAQLKCVAG
jgi:hypothetical protein